MKVSLPALLGVILLCISCKKDSDNGPEPGPGPVDETLQYVSMVINLPGKDTGVYTYNSDMTLKQLDYFYPDFPFRDMTGSLQYDNGRLAKIRYRGITIPDTDVDYNFFYNSAGKVIKVTTSPGDLPFDSIAYNDEGQLTAVYYTDRGKDVAYYTWENGNIVKSVYIDHLLKPADTVTTTYRYDNMKNMYACFGALEFFFRDDYHRTVVKNNVTSVEVRHSRSANAKSLTYEYNYNSKLYPVSVKVTGKTFVLGSSQPPVTSVTTSTVRYIDGTVQ